MKFLKRLDVLVALLVAWNGIYFYTGYGWNAISRYDQILALVEPDAAGERTLYIDRFLIDPAAGRNTGDWAQNRAHDAHYYPNKSPGTSLLGALAYAPLYLVERALGLAVQTPHVTYYNTYLINLFVSVLPGVLAALCFVRLLTELHPGRPRWVAFGALALYCGTLVFPYATNLTGHAAAAAWLVIATYAATRRHPLGDLMAGLAGGLAVLCEYPSVIPLLALLVYLAWGGAWRRVGWAMIGGLGPLAVYIAYHQLCFGHPLAPALAFSNPIFIEAGANSASGQFSLGGHHALYGLLFSPYRGLFWHIPVLAGVVLLARRLWRRQLPPLAWLALAAAGGYLLMALSFNNWHSGSRLGPAYLCASFPFWVILLSCAELPAAPRRRRAVQALLGVLLVVSVSNMFLGAALSSRMGMSPDWPLKPGVWDNPLAKYYGKLFDGDLHPWIGKDTLRVTTGADGQPRLWIEAAHPLPDNFNLGELTGVLPLQASLLPWLVGFLALLAAIWRASRPVPPPDATAGMPTTPGA